MKKAALFLGLFLVMIVGAKAQLYKTSTGKVSFYSKTPVENIEALSKNAAVILDSKTNNVVFKIFNTSFQFPNKLMQEHFNEKYMESETYPASTFSGKINEAVDYTKDGEYDVTVTGKLNIHGVTKERTIKGKVIVKNNTIQLLTDFKVKVADHNITVPSLVMAKIAEDIDVMVDALLNN